MDLKPFKLDIDDLIQEFAQSKSTTLADMKRIWMSKKFTFIFEAIPSSNVACFMQSLYAHSIGYMTSSVFSLSHRIGGLYCAYCLHETQPFRPLFKIYLSIGELKRLKTLIIDANQKEIRLVSAFVKHMLQRNIILFGFVDINEGSIAERIDELTDIQNAGVQVAQKKLFADTRIEQFMHMDLGKELEIDSLMRLTRDYAFSKEKAIKAGSKVVDMNDIGHIGVSEKFGEVIEKTAEDWNREKEAFFQQAKLSRHHDDNKESPNDESMDPNNGSEEDDEEDDGFGVELEEILSEA